MSRKQIQSPRSSPTLPQSPRFGLKPSPCQSYHHWHEAPALSTFLCQGIQRVKSRVKASKTEPQQLCTFTSPALHCRHPAHLWRIWSLHTLLLSFLVSCRFHFTLGHACVCIFIYALCVHLCVHVVCVRVHVCLCVSMCVWSGDVTDSVAELERS